MVYPLELLMQSLRGVVKPALLLVEIAPFPVSRTNLDRERRQSGSFVDVGSIAVLRGPSYNLASQINQANWLSAVTVEMSEAADGVRS